MNEQLYTTDTAVECLTRSVAEAVESGGRFTRAEFSVDDVATILEDLAASSGEGVAAAKYWRQLQAMTADRDRWVKLWETASNSVIRLQAEIDAAVQQPNRDALVEAIRKQAARGQYQMVDDRFPYESWAKGMADAVLAALAVPATGETEWEPAKWHELNADHPETGEPEGDTIRLAWDNGTVVIGRLTVPSYGSGHHQVIRMQTVFGGDTYVWPHGAALSRKVVEVTP